MELASDDNHKEEEEESRYDIDARQQPPKKRRRTGTKLDTHIYTFDEDDDEDDDDDGPPLVVYTSAGSDDEGHLAASNLSAEEAEYDIGSTGGDPDAPDSKTEKAQKKRSYWLSKGISV